jgi:ABC-2 type transport system ATP-binding protein
MAVDCVIETQELTRRYGRVEAVRALNLKVSRHLVTGFLGRNGAGKSTTIRMLLGMTHPSAGSGTVLGHAITDTKGSRVIRSRVAYVGEEKQLYDYMTVEQLIRFTASFYPDWRPEIVQRLQLQFELPSGRKVRALSNGMRTKLALLLVLARQPELLILDEPSEGLDPVSIEDLLGTLGAAADEGVTVFFSSHQIADVERIADHVCIIDHGRMVADFSLDDMRQAYRRITLSFATQPPERDFDLPGIRQIQTSGRQMVVWANDNTDSIIERARNLEAVFVDVAPITLREFFLETVKEAQ